MSKNLQDVMAEAWQYHQGGQLNEAEKRYRLVLEHAPDFAPAMHYLGVIGLQTNHPHAAIPLLQRASEIAPNDAAILTNLGTAFLQSGDTKNAVSILTKALQLAPNNPQILANLGNAEKQRIRYNQAIQHYLKALALDSNLPEVHRNIAICYGAIFDIDKALEHSQTALSLAPHSVEARTTFANSLLKADKPDLAIQEYLNLQQSAQDKAPINTNLALAYAATNRLVEARELAEQVIQESPEFLDGWLNLITITQELGAFKEAEPIIREALSRWPENVALFSLLARSKKFTSEQDEDFQQLCSLAQKPNQDDGDAIKLHFSLGKAYENIGNDDQAFFHYNEANRITKQLTQYQVANDLSSMANIRAGFDSDTLTRLKDIAPTSHLPASFKPIFIVGMPRSGSTLTEQILASHPDVSGAGELPYLARLIGDTIGLQNSMDCSGHLDKLSADNIYLLRQNYFEYIQKLNLATPCFTDKMLMNFLHLGIIKILFPDAPIIHCKREPLDSCLSIFKLNFSRNGHHYASDQEDLARFYLGYQDLMRHWHEILPGTIYDAQYEALIADQKGETEALLQFCGLHWDEACLSFHKAERRVKTLSVAQVREPIYSSSVSRYKRFEKHLGPMMQYLAPKN